MVTESSDQNKIISMSCLKKVIDTLETECGKSFTNGILWNDGMGAQFRFKFISQLLAGTMFLNKSLCWFYNDRHHDRVSKDDISGTGKNVIFWKVKSGQIVVHTPKQFSDAAMKFVLSITIVTLHNWNFVTHSNFVLNHRWLFTDFKQVKNLVLIFLTLYKSKT